MNDVTLDDKYQLEHGKIILSGIQALVRLPLDQHRLDQRSGLRTATLISGYRGSPLGGYDIALQRAASTLRANDVTVMPAINEELAATAVYGSQIAHRFDDPRYDGVVGIWYGKGPGVDRSGDAFRHANIAGVDPKGGVLVVAGDDPAAKSSTVPSASEVALYDAQIPTMYPGNAQEILELGIRGIALSRYCGSWAGLKIVTNVADEFSSVDIPERPYLPVLPARVHRAPSQNPALLAPFSVDQEREIHEIRLQDARTFAAANDVNVLHGAARGRAWIGIAAAGKPYFDVREALSTLGLDEHDLDRHGIRLLKLGMIYPLERSIVHEFADGLEEIVVVEEKRPFIQGQVRDLLYGHTVRPDVHGKYDGAGNTLLAGHGELDADSIAAALRRRLTRRITELAGPAARNPRRTIQIAELSPQTSRTPYFCSGCPHNRSTVLPEGSVANGAVGCSTMAMWMDRETFNIVPMGLEGAQWVGAAPFSGTDHIFQNMGDGTYLHSGSLAVRQAVAAKTSITFKILYNQTVAMTGGQDHDADMGVGAIATELLAEGVASVVVVTDDTSHYRRRNRVPKSVSVRHRDDLDDVQRQLREIEGVTALIYHQGCAAELRRGRKRGRIPEPPEAIVINESVCEGCGDCGKKSNCLSVVPVDTELGRKTQIDQSSCNKDFSCLDGNCPSFLRVRTSMTARPEPKALPPIDDLPPPSTVVPTRTNILMAGIGGTGVVTISQILGTAAHIDGLHVRSLDQTGLAQKGGSVVSHVKLYERATPAANKIEASGADTYIVFDMMTAAADDNLRKADRTRTTAIVSRTRDATGLMVRDVDAPPPQWDLVEQRLRARTTPDQWLDIDAEAIARELYGDDAQTNLVLVGAAFQRGRIPISAQSIERAIELNGVAVEQNLHAFRAGRKATITPDWPKETASPRRTHRPTAGSLSQEARDLISSAGAAGELRQMLEVRVPELIAYQNIHYAREYIAAVREAIIVETDHGDDDQRLSTAVAIGLHKLMAYKDEYEVARLHLSRGAAEQVVEDFGPDARVEYLLHPPVLKRFGVNRKIAVGPWFKIVFRLLYAMRRLRGTRLDPFARDDVRRAERLLLREYREWLATTLSEIDETGYEKAVRLARLPEMIVGYDDVKLHNIRHFHTERGRAEHEVSA